MEKVIGGIFAAFGLVFFVLGFVWESFTVGLSIFVGTSAIWPIVIGLVLIVVGIMIAAGVVDGDVFDDIGDAFDD